MATENIISTLPDDNDNDITFLDGLFLEGAKWCKDKHYLIESEKRVLHCKMPIVSIHSTQRTHSVCPKTNSSKSNAVV